MKKYILFTLTLAFGLLLTNLTVVEAQQYRQQQEVPQQYEREVIDKNELPDLVRGTLENEYEDWNILQAHHVSGFDPEVEAEGAESAQQFYMVQIQKEDEIKTVYLGEDGEEIDDQGWFEGLFEGDDERGRMR